MARNSGWGRRVGVGLPVSRPAVSQHLKVLKQLRGELEQFWSKALVSYKATVEQPTEEDP